MIKPYNDVIVNGKIVRAGSRASQARLEAIFSHCDRYNRPISVLDIGAAEGQFTIALASKFPGFFVAAEADPRRGLSQTLSRNKLKNVALLEKALTLQDLKEISSVQYFDIVLALSVVHHFDEPFQEVVDVILGMCSYCFFEHPDPSEGLSTKNSGRLMEEPINLSAYAPSVCAESDCSHLGYSSINRKMYLLQSASPSLISKHYFMGQSFEPSGAYKICADYDKIVLRCSRRGTERPWKQGLDLRTFFLSNGVYPSVSKIVGLIDDLDIDESNPRADLAGHNALLVDGGIELIDQDDVNHDSEHFFYISSKEMFVASLFLAYSGALPDAGLAGRVLKVLIQSKDGPVLSVVISRREGGFSVYSTNQSRHSMRIYRLDE